MNDDIFELLTNLLASQKSANKRYTGKVINNKIDGVFDGRCKIEVRGVFDGIGEADLPPASPEIETTGAFMCPEIGSLVTVYFENDDLYKPIYTTKVASHTALHANVSDINAVLFNFMLNGKEDLLEYDKSTGKLTYTDRAGTTITTTPNSSNTEIVVTTTQGITIIVDKTSVSIKNKTVSAILDDSKISFDVGGVTKAEMTASTMKLESGKAGFEISAGQIKSVKGITTPEPTGGPFCAIAICPILGPHTGSTVIGLL